MHTYKITNAFRHIPWFLFRVLMFREISVYMFILLIGPFTVHQAISISSRKAIYIFVQHCTHDHKALVKGLYALNYTHLILLFTNIGI